MSWPVRLGRCLSTGCPWSRAVNPEHMLHTCSLFLQVRFSYDYGRCWRTVPLQTAMYVENIRWAEVHPNRCVAHLQMTVWHMGLIKHNSLLFYI